MFVSKPRKVSLTLFCYLALALAIATVAQADTVNHNVARDHVVLNRMIRKRADIVTPGTNGAAGDPPNLDASSSSTVAASSTSAASSAAQTQSSASTSSSATSSSASQTSASSAATSSSSSATSSSATSSSAASSTQSSSSSSSSSSAQTSASAQPTNSDVTPTPTPTNDNTNNSNTDDNTTPQTSSKSVNRVTQTVTSEASATSGADGATTVSGASSSMPKAALTVIIVIASCVGAIAIGWTVIRKWKFKPSSDFDNRMNPIDWQPATADDGIPGLQRNASTASHGSFHSSGHSDENFAGRGMGYGTSNLQPIPDHDFTAGSTNLAPVGGYADLARGPSPGPQMTELSRGPSVGHGYNGQNPYDYNGRY